MIIEPHFEEIVEHFNAEYPREGCGVIGIQKGKSVWFPGKAQPFYQQPQQQQQNKQNQQQKHKQK